MAEQEQLNIYQKLAKIRKQVEVIQKNKRGYGYTYVSEEEILAKITVFMDKYHLSLVPGIVGGTTKVEPYPYKKTKTTKGGEIYEENVNEVLVSADMTWTWVNNDNPEEKVVVGWTLVGQQSDASQAFGSGLTYSDRYFLLKYFNVATTDDDPDAHRSKQRAAEAAEDKMIAEQIIGTFDEVVKAFLKANESKAEDVKKFVSKYAKGGNYFAITESTLAAKLLDDFKETSYPSEPSPENWRWISAMRYPSTPALCMTGRIQQVVWWQHPTNLLIGSTACSSGVSDTTRCSGLLTCHSPYMGFIVAGRTI